jgi:hypothetical protein
MVQVANSKRFMTGLNYQVLRLSSRLGFRMVATIDSELMRSTLMDCQSLLRNTHTMFAQLPQDLKLLKYLARVVNSSISFGTLRLTKVVAGLLHSLSTAVMVLLALLTLKLTRSMIQLLDLDQVSTHWLWLHSQRAVLAELSSSLSRYLPHREKLWVVLVTSFLLECPQSQLINQWMKYPWHQTPA